MIKAIPVKLKTATKLAYLTSGLTAYGRNKEVEGIKLDIPGS
jgi:hypothetical protein